MLDQTNQVIKHQEITGKGAHDTLPPYSLLTKLDLEKTSVDSWAFLAKFVQSYPSPTHQYRHHLVALIDMCTPGLKTNISTALAESGTAHAILRHGKVPVVILRTIDERSAIRALDQVSIRCGLTANQLEIIEESKRFDYALQGSWPLVIPYAATMLPTPAGFFDPTRVNSSGALLRSNPKILTLIEAAVSPKVRRVASALSGGLWALKNAVTLEKVGATLGAFIGGSPGAAAGTMAGKGFDGMVQTTGAGGNGTGTINSQDQPIYDLYTSGRLPWPQASEELEKRRIEAWVHQLVESGKITVEKGFALLSDASSGPNNGRRGRRGSQ